MTLDSTTSRVQYTQAGTTTEWPVTFKFLDAEDLIVITTVADVDTTLELDTDYTVDGAGGDSGGTVTISPAVAAGVKVTIYRAVELDQPTTLSTAGGWYPKVHEGVFDRLTMQIQQVQEKVDRAIKVGVTSTETPDNIMGELYAARDSATASASSASGFAGDASDSADEAALSAAAAAASAVDAQDAADSLGVLQAKGTLTDGQSVIDLPWTYNPTMQNVVLFLNGVKQIGESAFAYTDEDTLTLTTPVSGTVSWEVISVTLAAESVLTELRDQCVAARDVVLAAGQASETAAGLVELATTTEAEAGADTSRAVTAAGVEAYHKANNINLGATYTIIGNETAIDFGSTEDPIPEGVKRITVMFDGVSLVGTSSNIIVQLGNTSGFVTAGYYSFSLRLGVSAVVAGGIDTSGLAINRPANAIEAIRGQIVISKINTSWTYNGGFSVNGNNNGLTCGGGSGDIGTLDRLRITTVNGTDTFDAGTVNISWEF